MIARRQRLPTRWSIGTMLIFVGWCSVVVWLNVRPRIEDSWPIVSEERFHIVEYGFPWSFAYALRDTNGIDSPLFSFSFPSLRLAGNATTGLFAVFVLTLASSYLLRRITSRLASLGRNSRPPDS
jgi:hypothetical protein